MVGTSNRFTSFVVQGVPVERWRLYLMRFLLLFSVLPAVAAVFELPRAMAIRVVVSEGAVIALIMCGGSLVAERLKNDGKKTDL